MSAERRVVLLDRDGTIIVDKVYLADPGGIEFMPRAFDGIRRLTDLGMRNVVITNQAGIGRGHLTSAILAQIHQRMIDLIEQHGGSIEAIYHCPHHPDDGCACRKPGTGMLREAERDLGFRLSDAFMVGDSWKDVEAGRRCGATTLQVISDDPVEQDEPGVVPDHVVPDLLAASQVIEQIVRQGTRAAG